MAADHKKTVLITGASSGIGREFAHLYAEDKQDLIIVSRSEKELWNLKVELQKKHKIHVTVITGDLSKQGAAQELYKKIKAGKLTIDILINNAGFGDFGETVEMEAERVRAMLNLNILTLTELSILFGCAFKKRRSGGIINVASTAGFQPLPYLNAYSASKSYVLSFSEGLAKELEDHGVVVTCLCPGMTTTNFFKNTTLSPSDIKDMMGAREVALIGKKAFESKKLTVVAGFKNWLRSSASRFLPRSLVAKLAKRIMKE